jgi:hypothetical protein
MSDPNALDHSQWARTPSYLRKWSEGTEVIPGRSVPLTGRVGALEIGLKTPKRWSNQRITAITTTTLRIV